MIAPEPEGQAEAIPDEIASEEEASPAESEDISHPEEDEPEIEPVEAKQAGAASIDDEQTVATPPEGHGAPPEEESISPEKRVPARLARWIKEPKRLAFVAGGVIVIAVILILAFPKDDPPDPDAPGVASIEINPSEPTVTVDSTLQLTATLRDLQEKQLDRPVVWESSDSSIASVSQAGLVVGLGEGSATITAKSEAAQGTARVGVSPAPRAETQPGVPNIDFVLIPADTFRMGSTNGGLEEQPVHTVRLSSFCMSATEVTQGQWKAVMENNPSHFTGDDDLPVESVSWEDVQAFIHELNTLQGCGRCYRLPTEAEWEYAARAGTTGDYAGDLEAMGWYRDNSDGKAHPVRQKRRNEWGLYDMHGNVWEWVADWYGSRYRSGTVTDPTGPETGSYRVVRGGGFNYHARSARSARRSYFASGYRNYYLGFRLVREVR